MKLWARMAAIVIALAVPSQAFAAGGAIDPAKVVEPKLTPKMRLGKLTFDQLCAKCHGVNAVGTDQGPPLLHRIYEPGHHSDAAFYRAALQGARAHHWRFGDMKPVEGVKEAQVKNILLYVRALQKANGIF